MGNDWVSFLVMLLVGTLLIIYGLLSYKTDKNRLLILRCKSNTKATIIGFDDKEKIVKSKQYTEYSKYYTQKKYKKEVFYCPFLEFKDENGEKYQTKYKRPIERKLSVGQKIDIHYNEKNPYEFYIAGDKSIKIVSTQAIFAGAIIIILAFVLKFFVKN